MFRNDPIYLCGLYEAKLNVIQSILANTDGYLSKDILKLLQNILEQNQDQTDKEIRAAQKIIAAINYEEEKETSTEQQ